MTATKSKDKFTPKLADIIRRNFRDPNTKLVIQVKVTAVILDTPIGIEE